jgi:hypothetical protein
MTSPAAGFHAIMTAANIIGGASGWKGIIGETSPGTNCVGLIDLPGRGGEVKVAIDYPSVQILVVGSKGSGSYSSAFNKAKEIWDHFQGIPTPNAAWDKLVSAVAISQPGWLGRDESNRPRFSATFRLITTPENEVNRTL